MITKPDEVRQLYWTAYQKPALMLSIFMGVIGALALVMSELRRAPIGYESEDGFHFGEVASA